MSVERPTGFEVPVPEMEAGSTMAQARAAGLASPQQELFDLLEIGSADAARMSDAAVDMRIVHKGAPLFHQGTASGALYFVRGGTFKVYQVDPEGYEQVLRFPIRGEIMGFDSVCRERHPVSASALEESSVLSVGLTEVLQARQRSAAFDQAIQRVLSRQLLQVIDVTELMAAVAAEVRVARFLCQLSTRMLANGESSSRLLLRMSRRDIASYLGLAIETVSRCFSLLADHGFVRVDRRDVEILDSAGLRVAARSTRRAVEPLVPVPDYPIRPHPRAVGPSFA